MSLIQPLLLKQWQPLTLSMAVQSPKTINIGKGRTAGTNVTTADLHPLMTLVYFFSKTTVTVHLLVLMAKVNVSDLTVGLSISTHMLIDYFPTNISDRT